MFDGLQGEWVEWRTVEARDFDGRLVEILTTPEGRVAVFEEARARNWIDGTNLKGGAHETVPLKGRHRVRLDYVVACGPCCLPRG